MPHSNEADWRGGGLLPVGLARRPVGNAARGARAELRVQDGTGWAPGGGPLGVGKGLYLGLGNGNMGGTHVKLHPAPPSVVPLLCILISSLYCVFFQSPQKCCRHTSTSPSKQEQLRPKPHGLPPARPPWHFLRSRDPVFAAVSLSDFRGGPEREGSDSTSLLVPDLRGCVWGNAWLRKKTKQNGTVLEVTF